MPQQHRNLDIRRQHDPGALKRQAWLLVSCLALAVGFVMAARQQIAAVQYGYRIEELRRERESLLDDQRRLRLALEENASPAQLERSARALGLQPTRAAQIETSAAAEQKMEPQARTGAGTFVGTAATTGALRQR